MSDTVIRIAREWIGTPYHHQQSLKGVGTDCLGVLRGIWRELYSTEPEMPPAYSQTWGDFTDRETMLEAAERNLDKLAMAESKRVLRLGLGELPLGCVLFFRPRASSIAKHCAVLVSRDEDGTMVHAYSGVGVRETSVGVWGNRIAGVFAFPGH